jgi:Gluconate 2-dehydrogenase subunit 3
MNRRTAIRSAVIIGAGVALLPACKMTDKGSIPLKNLSITRSEQSMLEELCEAIIPKTKNFAGAKDLKSHEFLLAMIDDCTSPEEQKIFTAGLKAFDKLSHDKFGQIFTGYTAEQKKSLLSDIEKKNGVPDDVIVFYKTVKRYTVQSFTSSRQYMLEIRKYKMAPGPGFKGCVPVKNV